MRPALILLSLVVVLGCAREAAAWACTEYHNDYTISIAGQQFGFCESKGFFNEDDWEYSRIYVGLFGHIDSSLTAKQGLIGFCVIVSGLIALVTVGALRWRRKPSA